MGEETEHEASRREYALVGSFGTLLYSSLALFVFGVLRNSRSKNKKTLLFFKLMIGMCICEIPRFFCIAVTWKYDWRSLYIIHILSGSVFFAAFSVVCMQWSSLLKLGSFVKVLFTSQVLIAINVAFAVWDLAAVVACARSSSLISFFESAFFYFYIFGDALKNIFFSVFLAFYGIRLIAKFYGYSKIELNESTNIVPHSVFQTALSRLTATLVVASVCFVTRLVMLILKSMALNSDDTITSERFTLFGFYWFCFSDFIPRALPSLTFVLLMRSKRRGIKRELDSSLSKGVYLSRRGSGHTFTFVGDEEDYDEDESDEEYFSGDDDDADAESVALFDPPPGSFIDDKDYSFSPSIHADMQGEEGNEKRASNRLSVSDIDIARERKRHEDNSNEMSLTSFKTLSMTGSL